MLAWVSKIFSARVSGFDYCPIGIDATKAMFLKHNVTGNVFLRDVLKDGIPEGEFDFVYSIGVAEHFVDPRPIISSHIRMTKVGGKCIIAIPVIRGIYLRSTRRLNPNNLSIHNLRMMSENGLGAYIRSMDIPQDNYTIYKFGRLNPGLLALDAIRDPFLQKAASASLSAISKMQPFDIAPIAPLLVLEIRKEKPSAC